MKHNYTVRSKDLLLTPVTKDDIELMREWRNSPVNQASFLTNTYIDAEQQKLWYQNYLNKDDDIMFIINDITGTPTKIGMVALYDINTQLRTAEFGRLLIGEPSARGRGLGLAVTVLLCAFGMNRLGLVDISLEVLSENTAARSVYLKAGFQPQLNYISEGREVIKMLLHKENLKCD